MREDDRGLRRGRQPDFKTKICKTCRRRRLGITNARGEFLCKACAITFLNIAHGRDFSHIVDLPRISHN